MSNAEDKIDEAERTLAAERKRLRELGDDADALERETNPPTTQIDHAKEGGIV
jgi:hypothetical protein